MAESTAPAALPSPELLAELAAGTELCMFLTGPYDDGMPLLWVNESFARKTGLSAGAEPPRAVPGRPSLGPLERVLVDPVTGGVAVPALASGEGGAFTMQCRKATGETYWSHVTFTPRRDADGRVTHFLGVSVDVSEYVDERSAQLQTLAVERRQRADLDLVAQTTELLGDLEYPFALRDIAELLRSVVPWAAFYLNDDGLLYAEGIDVAAPPGGRGRRHARHVVDAPAGVPAGAATEAGTPRPGVEAVDAVQDLLDGLVDGPVLVRLDVEYPPFSASGWLRRDLVTRVLDETGVRPATVVVHAVGGRRQVLGLLVTWNGDQVGAGPSGEAPGMAFNEPDDVRTVVEVIARRAGTAIDNARLYAREHRLAEALQRAMLPEQADVTGLDVWTYYAPNAEHAQVGGDWYDVLDIDGTTVGLVIGDVVGHDVEAAAAMGQLRSVVRSYAYELTTPGVVLDRVDQLVQGMRIPRSASLVYATLRKRDDDVEHPGEERWDMEYTRAGHLPPLLLRDGRVRQLEQGGGSLVGFGIVERRTAREVLRPGDVLLFYTDGLIERRDRSLKVGLDTLVETSARITARDAAGVGEELLSRLADAPEDDVAIVVVRLPDPVADAVTPALSPRSRRWLLPSEPASIARARHAVLRSCEAWGLADSASAELVVSELVANGVLHGWGNIALRLFDTGDGLRIEVEDANPAPPVTTDGHPNRVGGFGMQIVERLADWGWRPSGSGKLVWAKIKQPAASMAAR
ncbi:protein serine/threonine phosphatase [Xylanimonas cellulosilytica DSM 15894]|uniref:Protein serine/threonine phosphatase n=1 Tax=Xylanimonas cellulosilytica (strain DSM 15894 / JCM 12276 / CECT 5975 / KCTC 9989 / LMG 20990 / NBRC 107835 / XIL07) TaxID=446471 RepID=D1C013_XYLCX|nr:SpoIIE family protein phosphatase [Xylanimonas cellulosilytica]ACZ32141.1 protein serine/threonine phosphatase [Xylanimonas cellulosilytica DSM 15894]